MDETKPNAKHVPKAKRSTRITPSSPAALRLLLFTGCRLREILHLRWEHVDIERGCLFLPDSKSGRKTVILNAPALAVLNALERIGPYVVPGDDPEEPRARPKAALGCRYQAMPVCPACACTICGTPMQASVLVAGWACRSSAGYWGTLRQRPPRDMRTSTMIHYVALQSPSQAELQPRWMAMGGFGGAASTARQPIAMSALLPYADIERRGDHVR